MAILGAADSSMPQVSGAGGTGASVGLSALSPWSTATYSQGRGEGNLTHQHRQTDPGWSLDAPGVQYSTRLVVDPPPDVATGTVLAVYTVLPAGI